VEGRVKYNIWYVKQKNGGEGPLLLRSFNQGDFGMKILKSDQARRGKMGKYEKPANKCSVFSLR
jgi:hypothetical protein